MCPIIIMVLQMNIHNSNNLCILSFNTYYYKLKICSNPLHWKWELPRLVVLSDIPRDSR